VPADARQRGGGEPGDEGDIDDEVARIVGTRDTLAGRIKGWRSLVETVITRGAV
jgi:hypothetical protein